MPMDEAPAAVHTTMRKSSPMRYPTTIMMTPGSADTPAIIHVPRGRAILERASRTVRLNRRDTNPIGMVLKSAPSAPGHLPVANRTIAASSTRAPNIALKRTNARVILRPSKTSLMGGIVGPVINHDLGSPY